jgi:uncharacterized protein YndB with AHSA1/START domain
MTKPSDREVIITRAFAAPREKVFEAWTTPEHLMRWWGPPTWPLVKCTLDLRPGGVWHYCMGGPDGAEAWGRAVYSEIAPPERLCFTDAFSDAQGSVIPPESSAVVTFRSEDGGTLVAIHTTYASPADLQTVLDMGMEEGMGQALGQLEDVLASI